MAKIIINKDPTTGEVTYPMTSTQAVMYMSGGVQKSLDDYMSDVNTKLDEKQTIANKVTAFQATPDDTHYCSEKLVYDKTQKVETITPTIETVANVTVSNVECKQVGKTVFVKYHVVATDAIPPSRIISGLPNPVIQPELVIGDDSVSITAKVRNAVDGNGKVYFKCSGAISHGVFVYGTYLRE